MTFPEFAVRFLPDLLLCLVLLGFCISGWIRGLIRSLSHLFIFLVSLFGAKVLADLGAPLVAGLFSERLEPYVSEKLAAILTESGDLGVLELIPGVQEVMSSLAGTLAESLAPAVALALAECIAWFVILFVGYLVLRLLCRLVVRLLDRIADLPGLHLLNRLGGLLLGGLTGFLLLKLVLGLAYLFGVLPESLTEQTILLRFFSGIDTVN